MGRPAKPDAVLKLHGTYREDRHAKRGVKTGGEPLRKPELDEVADAHWELITRTRGQWLASSDTDTLKRLCELWSMARRLFDAWKQDVSDKELRVSALATHAEWAKLAAKFGLTPSDRARLGEGSDVHCDNAELEAMLQ